MSKVSLTQGENRYRNVLKSLKASQEEIYEKIQGKRKILIKVNFVSDKKQLAATHLEGVLALLDFLKPLYQEKITIAEGSFRDTWQGFKNFGYLVLPAKYNVELVDLNHDKAWQEVKIYNKNLEKIPAWFSKKVSGSDFIISICPPKTHDTVIVTLSLKNLLVGSLKPREWHYIHDRFYLHTSIPAVNLSLASLAKDFHPHLSIIDGFWGMEGNGPQDGQPVNTRWALVSLDFLAADSLATYLMGFLPREVGYLYYSAQENLGRCWPEGVEIIGEDPGKLRKKFKPHQSYQEQLAWRLKI